MEIVIKGTEKEIADFVLEIQNRHEFKHKTSMQGRSADEPIRDPLSKD